MIMSMRNGASTVGAAVCSVLQQTLTDFELIVIDNGSSDQAGAIVAGFDDARIRLVREESTSVFAVRLNQAVALAKGEFIARMDADDICFSERLSRQVARLREDPQLDLIGCEILVFTSGGELIGEMPAGINHSDIIAKPFVGFPLPHPTWCGRASWFRNNPYNSELGYVEDQDLLLRSTGWQFSWLLKRGSARLSPGSAGAEETHRDDGETSWDRHGAMERLPANSCRRSRGLSIMPQRECWMSPTLTLGFNRR